MSKIRILYIAPLVILGVPIGFNVFKPMATSGKYSEVEREQLLQTEDEWIIEFNIINHEGRDQNYTINVWVNGKQSKESVLIPHGRIFAYSNHIYKDQVTEEEVSFAIYKEGDDTPFEKSTYYLK